MESGRILFADDEATFLKATADLLRREGYDVDEVPDATCALQQIAKERYDLLITDLEMPGNSDLQLVRTIAERSGGLPVIILTGYPSVRSAVASIELPVAAYLTKPVAFDQLLDKTRGAVTRYRSYQAMQSAERRLKEMQDQFAQVATSQDATSVDVFLALTLRNVMGSLTDLQQLSRALTSAPAAEKNPCQLLNCPRGAQLQAAVKETVDVLEETKGAFKSKTLGELRRKLELLLEHV